MRTSFGRLLECLWSMFFVQIVLGLETSGHLICGVSYFDFIYMGLKANQMPKKDALGMM